LSLNVPIGGPNDVSFNIKCREPFEKSENGLKYKGGDTRILWPVNVDHLSYFKVKGLVEDIGFANIQYIYCHTLVEYERGH